MFIVNFPDKSLAICEDDILPEIGEKIICCNRNNSCYFYRQMRYIDKCLSCCKGYIIEEMSEDKEEIWVERVY